MPIQLGTFGSIFKYRDGLYVYFAISAEGDRIFAAKILNEELTSALARMAAKYEKRTDHPLSASLNLCFVILSTDEFKGQAASLAGTGRNVEPDGIEFLGKALNEGDTQELRELILKDKAIPAALVTLLQDAT